MNSPSSAVFHQISSTADDHHVYLKDLISIFASMDADYEAASRLYGFVCRGCDENCCRTKFYHHTFLEYLYIRAGFDGLPKEEKQAVIHRVRAVRHAHMIAARNGIVPRQMCPINVNNRCLLYSHRPMICRLHGIPHELSPPGQTVQFHRGCDAFHNNIPNKSYYCFDRTPLYRDLAALEKRFKIANNLHQKIKMTIAEMIVTFDVPFESDNQNP